MGDPNFPKSVSDVIATLADIFRHQGRTEIVELLDSAHAFFDEINYDNWNGGTYTWALRLETPVGVFASLEPHLSEIEQAIMSKLAHFNRLHPNHQIGEVTVTPIAPGYLPIGQRMAPPEIEVRRLWPEGRFRLFLSHVSTHKIGVSKLKHELSLRGVAAFVAHEDIQPSLEWQHEIELALSSMHAEAALITSDFHGSFWTDQEVGWAFGRGIIVVPVCLGTDPYGFAAKVQGIRGTLERPSVLAESIVNTLLANTQTHGEMRRALASAFAEANSSKMALALCAHIVQVGDFTEEEQSVLRRACEENGHVTAAQSVSLAVQNAIGLPDQLTEGRFDDVPF